MMLELIFTFFKIGLFSVGGGLATMPFIYELANTREWISIADVSNLVAISESTPGPLGVNMATYVGYLNSGALGAVLASLSLVTPSVIVIFIISGFLKKFRESKAVKNIFYGLRAASCGLIAAAGAGVVRLAFFGEKITDFFWQGAVLAVILFFAVRRLKWHPIAFIGISAVIGIVFRLEI